MALDETQEILAAMVRDASAQLALLSDGLDQTGPAGEGLLRTLVELQLESLTVRLSQLAEVPGIETALATECRMLSESARALRSSFVHVSHYLSDLSAGWRCGACGAKTAEGAEAESSGTGPPSVALFCRRCGVSTPLTEEGRQAFERCFGALVEAGWEPSRHGFRTVGGQSR